MQGVKDQKVQNPKNFHSVILQAIQIRTQMAAASLSFAASVSFAPLLRSASPTASSAPPRRAVAVFVPRAAAASPKPAASPAVPKRKALTGITKPQPVSPALQAVVGAAEIPRTEALKRLWAYIKQNNLQDPEDKKIIVCDDKLKVLFAGRERVGFLDVAKLLNPHFVK